MHHQKCMHMSATVSCLKLWGPDAAHHIACTLDTLALAAGRGH